MKNIISSQQLMVFCKVVETGSFSIAAQKLEITPSAVSKSISQLESYLGFLLLKRTTRSFSLTEAGRFVFDHACCILEDLTNFMGEAEGFRGLPQGRLQISCTGAFGCSQLIPLINHFYEQYPQVDIHVVLTDSLDQATQTDFELALHVTNNPPRGYSTRKLTNIHWCYCASPTYLNKYGEPQTLESLKNHTCLVSPEQTHQGEWKYNKNGRQHSVLVKSAFQTNNNYLLWQSALNHMGIAYLPTYLIGASVENGELQTLFPSCQTDTTYSLYAMYYPSRYNNPKIRAFIDFLVETIYPDPPWDQWLKHSISHRN